MIRNRLSSLLTVIALAGLLLGGVSSAIAQDGNGSGDSLREKARLHQREITSSLKDFREAKGEARLTKLKLVAERVISTRQDAITGLVERLTSAGKCESLTDANKAEIKAAIDAIAASLEAQKTAIENATDLETAKTALRAVFTKNKVFSAIIPATNGACLAHRLTGLIDGRLTTLVAKIKAAGIDTADVEVSMAEAKTSAEAAYSAYLAILQHPTTDNIRASFTTAKSYLQAARGKLATVKSTLAKIRGDYEKKTTDDSGTN